MQAKQIFTVIIVIAIVVAVANILPLTSAIVESAWTTKTPLPKAMADLKAGVVNNRIFVFGPQVTYEYDLSSWLQKHPMPSSRDYFATATYQNKIYCIGGRSNGPSAANEAYNPLSDSWESKQAMPTARHGLDANVVNEKIYLISGLVPDNRWPNVNVDVYTTYRLTNITEVYDPSTDTWATKSPIPKPAAHYSSAVIDNKIYIFSSHYNQATRTYDSLTQIYDPATDTWSNGNPPPYAVEMASSTTLSNSKLIFLIGGRSSSLQVAYNQIYDFSTNSWSIGAPLPTARYGLTVCNLGNKIYTFGGYQGAFVTVTLKADNEQYDPSQDKPIQFISSPTPTQTPTQTPTSSPTPNAPTESFSTTNVIAAIILSVTIASGLLILKLRKRKNPISN